MILKQVSFKQEIANSQLPNDRKNGDFQKKNDIASQTKISSHEISASDASNQRVSSSLEETRQV